MGSLETDKPAKEAKGSAKKTPTSQEQSSGNANGVVRPHWNGFQAFTHMPPHRYLASTPQPHPYVWGVQHLLPPYGTAPHPYFAMYPHGGLSAHPSMPLGSYPFNPYAMSSLNGVAGASANAPDSIEVNGKPPEGKEKLSIKRSKGSLGSLNMITSKISESNKAEASANGSYSTSGESGSEGSSEGSDENSENKTQMKSGSRQDSMEGEASQNGNAVNGYQNGGLVNQTIAFVPISAAVGPTTSLNMALGAAGPRENMQPQLWLQDERELKRQKRKQSNRESANRSRWHKQGACDELARRADALNEENASLKTEVTRIRSDYEHLLAENAALKERLGQEEEKQQMGSENHQDRQTERELRYYEQLLAENAAVKVLSGSGNSGSVPWKCLTN